MKHLLYLAFTFFCTNVFAQTDTLFKSSVQDIMNLPVVQKEDETVTTASKVGESVREAPAVLSVITAKEIAAFGATNLREIIERVTGVLAISSYLFPDNAVSMRASLLSHYDNHILLLFNGRPMREGLTGGVNTPIYLAFPLSSIARIEVIRGPGSVLYGSNAFAGVINIITHENQAELSDGLKVETNGFAGSFGTFGFQAGVRTRRKDLILTMGTSFLKSEGWNFKMVDEAKDTINKSYGQYNMGANLGLRYKKLSLSTAISHSYQDNLGALPIKRLGTPNKNLRTSRAFVDAGYDLSFSKNWTGKVNLTYNSFSESYFVGASVFNAFSNDLLAEFENKVFLANNKVSVLVGGTGYLQTGGGYEEGVNNVPLYQQFWWSGYAQADWKATKGLKIIAGVQANKPQGINLDFVPRLGLVYNLNENYGIKVLYAQAFRSAFALERSLVAPGVLRGNPNLKPEKVNTFDFQVFRYTEKLQLSVNYFQSKLTDIITRIAVPSSPENTYGNLGVLQIWGIEAEAKAFLSSKLYATASYSFNRNTLNDSIKNATHIPESSAKFGISYTDNTLNVGFFSSIFSDFGDVATIRASRALVNPIAKGFSFLTLNLSIDVFKVFKIEQAQSLMFYFYSTNLLDTEIYYPEFSRRRINTIPGRAGRAIQVGLRLKL